jgi:hypothetical protein
MISYLSEKEFEKQNKTELKTELSNAKKNLFMPGM